VIIALPQPAAPLINVFLIELKTMTDSQSTFKDEVDALELLMLRGEASVKTRSAMLSIALLDEVPDFTELRATFDYASRQFIRLRQHIVAPALAVTAPRWVVDPDFNLDYHLRRISAASPGKLRDVLDTASQILAAPMDTQRPLWEVFIVEGVKEQGAKAALVIKMHHAVSDGMGGLMLLKLLFNDRRATPARPPLAAPIPEDIDSISLSRRGISQAIVRVIPSINKKIRVGIRGGKDLLQHPSERLDELKQHWQSAKRILSSGDSQPSPLLMRRSLGRRLDVLEYPLADLKACAKTLDASVNDIYIAAIAGGLHRYHSALGCKLAALPLAMPVNLRTANDTDGGNHFAAARISLPLSEADPKHRINLIQVQVQQAIAEPAINIVNRVAPLLVHLPASALKELSELASHVDVQASNVPGFRDPAYIAGSKIVKMYPFGPLPGIPLMLVMMSHEGVCYIGSHCDTAAFSQPDLLIQCLSDEFNALLKPAASPAKKKATVRKPVAAKKPAPKKTVNAKASIPEGSKS
jgi:diacylglycerol O-acyltransferase